MGMRTCPIVRPALLAALACAALAAPAAAQRRVLYLDYVGPPAHDHASRPNARTAMTAIAQASGGLFTVDLRTDPTGLDAAALAPYDAIVFFTCGDLPADHPLRPALLAFVAGGKGFVGFHSATDSFYSWPEYGHFIGARFVTHGGDNRPGTIRLEDPTHVAMQGFTNPFSFVEEFYLFKGPSNTSIDRFTRRDLHVLMNLDPATPVPARPTPQPEYPQLDGTDLPLAWTRQHGAGRVFYSALGHLPATWDGAPFRAHAAAAIRWALGDGDADGLDDRWELTWGVRDYDAGGVNGPAGDPDGDGRTNAQEQAAGTHPRGFAERFLAEGATSIFFETRIGVLNPNPTFSSRVQLRYQLDDGSVHTDQVTLAPRSRRTMTPPQGAAFSTLLVSDQPVVVDRTMTWGLAGRYGSHAESSLGSPALDWYFAEGATHGAFDLFFLIQNPTDQAAQVTGRYLRGPVGGGAPVTRAYTVGPHQRLTINADFVPGLEAADVSGEFHSTNGTPIIVERAMYMSRGAELWTAGIDGTGVTAPGLNWFLAEGSTGTFFDTFVQVANPSSVQGRIHVTFQRPFGALPIERDFDVPALSRLTIPVDEVDPALAATALSVSIAATNGIPVVVERSMWWPGNATTWYEGHATLATNTTGTAWAVADGETNHVATARTYLLVASGVSATDSLRVTLCRDAGPPIERVYTDALVPNGRLTIDLSTAFPDIVGERVGVILESMGQSSSGPVTPMPIVVERGMYNNVGGLFWSAGSNMVATRLR
jgi:type 1 glutamine amidotransferase